MPKPVVCPVWPSFDANPKVERGLNRPCPVGQSCHTLFPHRNPTDPRLWSEACRLESERCTGSIDCILHSPGQHRQQQALMMLWHRVHGGEGRATGDQRSRLAVDGGLLQRQVAACLLAACSSNRQSYKVSHATVADVCTLATRASSPSQSFYL